LRIAPLMFTAFVSDLHLTAARPPATRAFFAFLDGVAVQADALYILGDLFEYWAGDDDLADPFNREVALAVKAVSARGVPVRVIRGNRDFLLLERFAGAAGVSLMQDPALVDLYGTPTLLMHGDLLCTQDWRYQMFRKVVRNRGVQRWFMRLPLDQRKRVIGGARRMSEGEKQAKKAQIMDVTPAAVVEAFRAHGCARLIHGHTHRPARHEHAVDGRACERWVLSDWYERGQYLRVTPAGCTPVDLPFA
jgi:UDP-2,3-diacylglucosamine hydrolase